jgi:phosphoglycerate kinase
MLQHFSLTNYPVANKKVFLRVDFNTPLLSGKVTDNTKTKAALPTINYLLKQRCVIILATHLGRPKGKVNKKLKTDPLAKELRKLLPKVKIKKLADCIGKTVQTTINKSQSVDIFLLENLRFYKEEKANDALFAHSLANLADVYVNDAFAVCHRAHASIDAITHTLPSIAGLSLENEILNLRQALKPRKPAIWLFGGAKLDKLSLLNNALRQADYVLVGGALCFSFLKAQGISVGMSKLDMNSVKIAGQLIKKKLIKKIILPVDFVVTNKLSPKAPSAIVPFNQIQPQQIGLDLGPETIKLFKHYLRKAHTIVWNGPLGYFEWTKYAKASRDIGKFISRLTATSIVGGGETAEMAYKFHLQHDLTHISTGGGASLAFLSGLELPGLNALEKNYLKYKHKIKPATK